MLPPPNAIRFARTGLVRWARVDRAAVRLAGSFARTRLARWTRAWVASLAVAAALPCVAGSYQASNIAPPPVMREFRGMWIPTVGNSCWPSKPGLTTAQQKAELLALLDRAAELKLNAVIFQIRPAGDALYKSALEPWSEYLTGTMGQAPSPFYDPLEFAVTEAHKRGLELHAWFNPFRAGHTSSKSPVAFDHISRTHPEWTRHYGKLLWLDPGEPGVRDHALRVVRDVLRRYDVDAIHFDDYFYPYPEKDAAGGEMDFPDSASWKKYGPGSGLSRDDWRRRNVDQFVQRVYNAIKAEKPPVKFGLSPFGIWRPKTPPGIAGLDAYDKLFADARKWLREGWCDYLSPQLYWGIEPKEQSFPVLLKWWDSQNPKNRNLWPGLNSLKVGNVWSVDEITNQIRIVRQQSSTPGHVHWSAAALMKNNALRTALANDTYRQPALIPRFAWLDAKAPATPEVKIAINSATATAQWSSTNKPALWIVQSKQFGDWKTQILPAAKTSVAFDLQPELIAISAVDRCGNQSAPAVMKLEK